MSNLDEAIARFQLADLEYAGGLASHGPMSAEALESLGHHALIPAFADIYVPRLPVAEPGRVLSEGEADASIGDLARRFDWIATYEARLDGGDWRAVVAATVPDLLPGLFAGAGHGFLRTAHAVRSLEREDSPLRRRELARGLAYWTARYQSLPGLPGSRPEGEPNAGARLVEGPLLGDEAAREGLFFEAVRALESFRPFVRSVEGLTLPGAESLDAFLDDLCRAAATLYCAHPESRIAYVHGVTLPNALRWVAPLLASEDLPRAAGQVYQAVAALHAVFGREHATDVAALSGERAPAVEGEPDFEVERAMRDWNEIRYLAACSIQEHAIKMVDACWQSFQRVEDPVFTRAAADAAVRLEGTHGSGAC